MIERQSVNRKTYMALLTIVGMIALIAVAAINTRPAIIAEADTASSESQFQAEQGEARKTTSGISFADQTVVVDQPSDSATAKGFDSERVWSGHDDWEPAVAADPSSSYVYQITTRYDDPRICHGCASPVLVFRRSRDGGATWEPDKLLAVTKKSQNDPQIEVASDGTLYVAWLNDYQPGVKFMKSPDHGDTWTTPIQFTDKRTQPNWSDRPSLAISRDGRDVYVAFNASDSYVVVSHNYGASFSAPIKTSNDTRYWFHTAGAVSGNGDVYFAATDYSQDYTGDTHIDVIKSADGGHTWTTTRVDTSAEMPDCAWAAGCYFGFLGSSAGLAVDRSGKIMIAYNANQIADSPEKMYVRTSTDGIHWSARREISNGSSTVNNGFPAVAAGLRPGDFRVVWQDDRSGSTTAWNTWYRRTTNGGATWSTALRLSDRGSGAPYKSAAGYGFPYGDYFEIAVDANGVNHIIWGEGMSYSGPGGSWYTRGQ
jgi:hypothetical protein